MKPLSIAGVLLSLLLLAAHFLRAGRPGLLVAALAAALLLLVARVWAALVLRVVLLLGAAEWLRASVVLVDERRRAGAPFLRVAMILGGVALFTATSAALVGTGSRKRPRTMRAGKNYPD